MENRALSDLLGFTVFSFKIQTDLRKVSDPSQAYWMPEAGWYDLVFEAAEKIRRKHNLATSPMLLWGNSSGAGMAQRLALKYPEQFLAVATMGGADYANVSKATKLPWLVMNTLGAGEQEDNLRLVRALQDKGETVVYGKTPPRRNLRGTENYYHSAGTLAVSLLQSFFGTFTRIERRKVWQWRAGNGPYLGRGGSRLVFMKKTVAQMGRSRCMVMISGFACLEKPVPTFGAKRRCLCKQTSCL
ncbi:MAG: alpha/beta hydrolase [Blastochloris sp.]|nr:alpha/beta hydrolase [Blastochloris sp.]